MDPVETEEQKMKKPLYTSLEGQLESDNQVSKFTDLEDYNTPSNSQVGFFGTVMNLLNTLIGAEILSISRSMRFCGLVVSVGLMTFTAILSYISTILTIRLQNLTHAESFYGLAKVLYGKSMTVVLSVLVLVFTYTCCVAYLIIAGNDIQSWLELLHHADWMEGWKRPIVMFIYSIFMPVVLTIPKKVKFLSVFSTFAIFSVFFFAIILVVKGFTDLAPKGIDPTVLTAKMNIHFFNAISVYSLMFALPAICLPLLRPVKPKLQYRYQIVGTSFFSCYLLVIVPGVIGYLLFGDATKDIILENFDNHDIIIQIVRFGFFIVVTTSYPIIALTIQTQLSVIIFKVPDPASLSNKKRALILLLTNFPPVLIAMVLPNIYPVISVGGSLGGCMTNFFFPAIFWLKITKQKMYHVSNLFCIFLAIFGLVSAVIATYQGIELAIHPDAE